ncbi:hypothetical protein R3P38DRAFT_3451452 [Favolaschia claudopus]|uniref:Uncharacterized protein n=1 Tax=Favolaschia claudopus TaxID=2862362 RepID=A0AAV9ZKP3_9AGAR
MTVEEKEKRWESSTIADPNSFFAAQKPRQRSMKLTATLHPLSRASNDDQPSRFYTQFKEFRAQKRDARPAILISRPQLRQDLDIQLTFYSSTLHSKRFSSFMPLDVVLRTLFDLCGLVFVPIYIFHPGFIVVPDKRGERASSSSPRLRPHSRCSSSRGLGHASLQVEAAVSLPQDGTSFRLPCSPLLGTLTLLPRSLTSPDRPSAATPHVQESAGKTTARSASLTAPPSGSLGMIPHAPPPFLSLIPFPSCAYPSPPPSLAEFDSTPLPRRELLARARRRWGVTPLAVQERTHASSFIWVGADGDDVPQLISRCGCRGYLPSSSSLLSATDPPPLSFLPTSCNQRPTSPPLPPSIDGGCGPL